MTGRNRRRIPRWQATSSSLESCAAGHGDHVLHHGMTRLERGPVQIQRGDQTNRLLAVLGIIEVKLRKLGEVLDEVGPAVEADHLDADGLAEARRVELDPMSLASQDLTVPGA